MLHSASDLIPLSDFSTNKIGTMCMCTSNNKDTTMCIIYERSKIFYKCFVVGAYIQVAMENTLDYLVVVCYDFIVHTDMT